MATIPEALEIAVEHHQAGRLAEAEQIYRQIVAADPCHAGALHLLGVIAHQAGQHEAAVACIQRAIALQGDAAAMHNNLARAHLSLGRPAEAVACYRRALELDPHLAEAHFSLGNTLNDLGETDEAIACHRRAVELKPDYAEAHHHLGVILSGQGRPDEALARFRRAVELKPDYPEAHNNLGVVLSGQGKTDEALACYRRAIQLRPDYAQAHGNLGLALHELGKPEEAVACHQRALQLLPDCAELHNNLGNAWRDQCKLPEALACYRQALALKPDFAEAHCNLGTVLWDQGNPDQAVACFRRALELKPNYALAHNSLGAALRDRGQPSAAAASYRRALELNPDMVEAYSNLGVALWDQGKLDEAVAALRQARRLKPGDVHAHSNLLGMLQYSADVTPAALAEAHAEFDRSHAASLCGDLPPPEHAGRRPGPLRVGFVSSDLGRHPVGYFLVGILENLSRQELETVCYFDHTLRDDMTDRIQAAAGQWHDVAGVSDQRLAQRIRADGIDVLFDLAGHTARNRLLVLARRPAPVQVTWAGYVGTTGLSAMDYILADRWQVPPEAERFYCERVLRMPDGYVCYAPPVYAPPVAPPPAARQGHVTFGCFNNPAKITPGMVAVWSRILRCLPGARMILKFRGWDDAEVVGRYRALFAKGSIDPAVVDMRGPSGHPELLAEYQQVDVALDTLPYNGGLTTCEALWMGVPVVTCPGQTFAGRHSLSHLSNMGLTETIARDLDEYVEIAVALAHDLPRLSAIRARLRPQMAASPLCDGPRFAANLLKVLGEVGKRRD